MKESEKVLERKIREATKRLGGWALKISSLHIAGLPDRLCLFPGGRLCFVEMKTTKEKPRKIQLVMHDKIRKLGFEVFVIDSTEGINELIKRYERE